MGVIKQRNASESIDVRQLAMDLVKADSQQEVISVLSALGLWEDESLWQPYGGSENNWGTVNNQQDSADQALVEKITNAADAILIRECMSRGIDPKAAEAPQSIQKALEQWLQYPSGRLAELPSSQRNKLARESIGIVASGSQGKGSTPTYAIYDFGVGQAPEHFADTFLSLGGSNKVEIPFVQGKYNMGSTGVFPFLGTHGLQLILSKRAPDLPGDTGLSSNWGLTIVRRDPALNKKNPVLRYLTDADGQIFNFPADSLPILPDAKEMSFGSYIRLYEYDIGASLRTNILFNLNYRLSLLIPEMPIPVRLQERRPGFTGNSMEGTLAGLATRVEEDRSNNLEDGFPASAGVTVDGSALEVEILAFKRKPKGERKKSSGNKTRKEKYADKEGVVLHLNGQAHGFLAERFFTRQSVGLSYIKDSLLIIVNCSKLSRDQQLELFMASRDRLKSGDLKKELEETLAKLLKEHPGLRALQNKRKAEAISDSISEDKPLSETLQRVVNTSPALKSLLVTGQRLSDPLSKVGPKERGPFVGSSSPTFLKTDKSYSDENRRQCEEGRDYRFDLSTDAVNDYFTRSQFKGRLEVSCTGAGIAVKTRNLWNGKLSVTLGLSGKLKLGDHFSLNFELIDDSMVDSLQLEIPCVIAPTRIKPRSKVDRKPRDEGRGSGNGASGAGLSIPEVHPVVRENWEDHDFSKESALRVVRNGESWDFFYNRDNIHLKTEQKNLRAEEVETAEQQYSVALVLIGLMLIDQQQGAQSTESLELDIEEQVNVTTRALSPVLLPMIRDLGGLDLTLVD